MYRDLQQRKKLPTIILLNVKACIPKDLSAANSQRKKEKQHSKQQMLLYFTSSLVRPNLCNTPAIGSHSKALINHLCLYGNYGNTQCRHPLERSARSPAVPPPLLFLCLLCCYMPALQPRTFQLNNSLLLTTKVPLWALPGWHLNQAHESLLHWT